MAYICFLNIYLIQAQYNTLTSHTKIYSHVYYLKKNHNSVIT